MPIHPVQTARRLHEAYTRYLKTIKPFQDEHLRQEFSRALEAENMLIKGPYLELTLPFATGKTIEQLLAEGILTPRFRAFCHETGLRLDRPLYWHQEEAVRKAQAGHNLVITTGTGSGKTEAFLIPILNWLAHEAEDGTLKQPGVRALLLYPMNALANDQMERLRAYLKNFPEITFGRYVGETPAKPAEALDLYEQIHQGHEPPRNELISREAMQKAPPHILLTNYAMLEYLLLRPADTTLFDGETGKHWHFLVLDEAHAYDGAQATEIAMLLRRLQDRVTDGGRKKLQAIAASATLGEESAETRAQISQFASKLFALDFVPEDVIFSRREPESSLTSPWGHGIPELYAFLATLADSFRQGNTLPLPESLPGIEPIRWQAARQTAQDFLPRLLHELLSGDQNIHDLRHYLQTQPLPLHEAARRIFPDMQKTESEQALANLISAAILAREREDKLPLLPARYHLFARALEGAFVCLNTEHPAHRQEGKPSLFLNRQKFCEHCGSRVFELANCTRCGMSYLIGDEYGGDELPDSEFAPDNPRDSNQEYLIQNSVIYENELEARKLSYFVLESLEAVTADEDSLIESEMESDGRADEKTESARICPRCGAVSAPGDPACQCGLPPRPIARVVIGKGKKRTLERCVSCSTYAKGGAVYRFLTGQDAPVSVLAGTLYRDVPEAKPDAKERANPGGGRKLLIFTDNRQRAAFFAPYLQRAQERQLRRRLMVEALKKLSDDEPLRFSDWIDILLNHANKANVFPLETSQRAKRLTIATWLMLEFSGLDKRLGLEGVGLLYFRPLQVANWRPPTELLETPWNFSPEEAYQILAILLNTLRRQGAVTYLLSNEGISLLDSEKREEFLPRAREFYVREQEACNYKQYGIYSWLPTWPYNNSRRDYLARLLAKKKGEPTPSQETLMQAGRLLSQLWEYLISISPNWLERETKEGTGTLYRLHHNLWEVIPTIENLTPWSVCDTCQNLTAFNVSGVCPTYGCGGTLQPLSDNKHIIEDNLYRYQYQSEEPLVLKAMEHTAQWNSRKAAEIQKQFIVGQVNALSCSTTFEMGVDVGDLNAVLLRNVPPTTANYIQRAGRAGRRSDSVAMAVTFAQRRQHDLTFYAEPERMIAGKVRPPIVPLRNEKIIRRHLHSVAFAAFLRWVKETRGWEYKNTGEFFAPEDPTRNGLTLFQEYLACHPHELEAALRRIVPVEDPSLPERLALNNWGWLVYLTGYEEAVLDKAAEILTGELNEFKRLEQEEKAKDRPNYDLAKQYQKIQDTIRKRDLLGYLGSKNVLPKYGFPSDVVPLQTDHLHIPDADNIELDRDLKQAISEFAPGGQVVAAGKIWYSRGIKFLPGRKPVFYRYAVCEHCNRINILPGEQVIFQCECGQSIRGRKQQGVYLVPEHGFVADNRTETPGENPPERIYASRIYLAHYRPSSGISFNPRDVEVDPEFNGSAQVLKRYARNAYLGLVNNGYGAGFYVCQTCGWSDVVEYKNGRPASASRNHASPLTHQTCAGVLNTYHIGHHFMTDVLQLRFKMPISGESAIYSLLYAILNGACDALEIPRSDVDGLIFYQDGEPSFLLFDTTPGGSGHVEMISHHLRIALEAAYRRVSNCEGCAPDTSCYSCLRGYTNQKWHNLLVRKTAARLLESMVGK